MRRCKRKSKSLSILWSFLIHGIKSGLSAIYCYSSLCGEGPSSAGEMTSFYVWHHFNKQWVAKELAKDERRQRRPNKKQKLAAQRAAEQQKAQAAAKEKAAQSRSRKSSGRNNASQKPSREKSAQESAFSQENYAKNRGKYMEKLVAGLKISTHLHMVQSAVRNWLVSKNPA